VVERLVERGAGIPLVLVPALPGRWEYLRAAVDALARYFRVVTFSLCDEPRSGFAYRAGGFDAYVEQIGTALDRLNVTEAVICGVSFGGRIALRFSARYPARTRALILVSTPGPGWHLSGRHARYVRRPRLFGPLFLAGTPGRLRHEIAAALPDRAARRRFARSQFWTIVRAPVSPTRMAARALLMERSGVDMDCAAVSSPTLIITGEPALDHVVPVGGTSEYTRSIRGAQHVVLEGTGHLGSITRPEIFAGLVHRFVTDRAPR
jgi:3-oxoadipate enol-lactonase